MHTHLTKKDRIIIESGLRMREPYHAIGKRVGRGRSVVWKEVQRNSDTQGVYDAAHAHRRARERRAASKYGGRTIENNLALASAIEQQLHPLVSPEVIAHDLPVCYGAIYAWIKRSRPDLKKRLPHKGRIRRIRGAHGPKIHAWTTKVRSIEDRPVGDQESWEGDTLRGGVREWLLTHTERSSLFELAHKVQARNAGAVQKHVVRQRRLHHTEITYDRGSEFADWQFIERATRSTIYFAHAGAPHERGKNENTNGRLRRVFPKKTRWDRISQREINSIVWRMNHTKRKSLLWRTPCEVYGKCCNST